MPAEEKTSLVPHNHKMGVGSNDDRTITMTDEAAGDEKPNKGYGSDGADSPHTSSAGSVAKKEE